MKKILLTLCCMALSWSFYGQHCVYDSVGVCNLVSNSGFENGICNSYISTYGLNSESFGLSNYPSFYPSRVTDWVNFDIYYTYAGSADLYSVYASGTYAIPNLGYLIPPWMGSTGLIPYSPFSYTTGVDNRRFAGLVVKDSGHAEPIATELIEPLDSNLYYHLSFWVFNTCNYYTDSGTVQTDMAVFFTDTPVNGSGPERFYPQNNSVQTNPSIRIPTYVDCVTPGDTNNGNNGWVQISYTFQAPSTTNLMKWLVIGHYVGLNTFGYTHYFIDDVVLKPIDSVEISGSEAMCDNDTYHIVNPNSNFNYTWTATNASNSPHTGTTFQPTWINESIEGVISVSTDHHESANCNGDSIVLSTLKAYPCCTSDTGANDVILINQSASFVINQILSSANTWATTDSIRIIGTFTVDTNFTFLDCPNILMAPSSTIEIDSGATLTIDGSTLQACGENMWRGILIPNTYAGLITKGGSEILEAEYAVHSQLGGKFDIDSTTFESNYLSVFMESATATDTFYNNHTASWKIKNSNFLQNPSTLLLPPHYGATTLGAIRVSDFWDGTSGNSSAPLPIGPNNTFYWANFDGYGVTLVNSEVDILNNSFYQSAGIATFGMDVISVPEPNYLAYVYIAGNTFEDDGGIYAKYSQHLNIYDNSFEDASIYSQYFEHSGAYFSAEANEMSIATIEPFAAIVMHRNTAVEIDIIGNTLELDGNCRGISVGTTNLAYANECSAYINQNVVFDPLEEGIGTYGYAAFDEILTSRTHGLNIIDNYVEKPVSSASPPDLCDGIGAVTDNALLRDNIVNYDSTHVTLSTGFILQGTNLFMDCNEVHDGDLGMLLTYGVDTFESYNNAWRGTEGGGWWLLNSFVGDVGNDEQPSWNIWTPSLKDPSPNVDYTFPYVISDGSDGSLSNFFYSSTYPGSLNWNTPENQISLNGGTDPMTSQLEDGSEYACNEDKTGYNYLYLKHPIDPKRIKPNEGANLAKGISTLKDGFEKRRNAERLYLKLSKKYGTIENPEVQAIYTAQKEKPFGQLMELFAKVEGKPNNAKLTALLAAIQPTTHEDILLKKVAEIAVRKRLSKDRSLSEEDLKALEEIAELCPLTDGFAVYQARYFMGEHWLEKRRNACEYPSPENLKKVKALIANRKPESANIAVYPNPTSGKLFIKGLSGRLDRIEVMNIGGKVLANFEGVKAQDGIDLSALPKNQVYLLNITHNGQHYYEKVILSADK
jgi:hypothetical protein